MTGPRFLSVADVLVLHAIAIEDQGGDASIRDPGALDSAVAQPMQQFGGQFLHEDIPAMASAYAFHICMNHPFLDGNKRAATAAMIAECLGAGLVHDNPDLAQKERFDTMVEAAKSIPAINEANIGAMRSEEAGDSARAAILHAQSILLTAIYRIAQDQGYEW